MAPRHRYSGAIVTSPGAGSCGRGAVRPGSRSRDAGGRSRAARSAAARRTAASRPRTAPCTAARRPGARRSPARSPAPGRPRRSSRRPRTPARTPTAALASRCSSALHRARTIDPSDGIDEPARHAGDQQDPDRGPQLGAGHEQDAECRRMPRPAAGVPGAARTCRPAGRPAERRRHSRPIRRRRRARPARSVRCWPRSAARCRARTSPSARGRSSRSGRTAPLRARAAAPRYPAPGRRRASTGRLAGVELASVQPGGSVGHGWGTSGSDRTRRLRRCRLKVR